uniref:Uncharacterized protein n=1 Tax=Clastoptera arizonana TaxID=38151 RepID=A0A1B6CZ27_9HEMI
MSLSVQVRPWAEDMVKKSVIKVCDSAGSDDEVLHLQFDGSDSGCQIEDDLSPLGLTSPCSSRLNDLTCISEQEGRIVVDVMERILCTVEESVGSAYQREVDELEELRSREEIDRDRSRERGKSRHRKADNPKKAVRRKRERSSDKKKSRRRSTSCSTTSSACSADYPRKHRRKHKHHRRSHDEPSPRVNPIFLWVKQDDTKIVEVLCEDYDKRNRIRLTKTAQGWRAIPRTERLASALSSRSSLDISSPTPPPLVNPEDVKQEIKSEEIPIHTKEEINKSENESICVLDHNENCDIDFNKKEMKSQPLSLETECKVEYNMELDNVNYENKNEDRLESDISNTVTRECDEKCHEDLIEELEEVDNKIVDDIDDVYTFVPTPKTCPETNIPECSKNEDTFDDDMFANDVEECTEDDFEMEELENVLNQTVERLTSPTPLDLVVEHKPEALNTTKVEENFKKVTSLNEIWRIPEETTVKQTTIPINAKTLPEVQPAHQQKKTKFLESILSGPPQKCHPIVEKREFNLQDEPLDLGMSRKSASPTVSSSDNRKIPQPDTQEPVVKKMKVEEITLKAILKSKDSPKTKYNKGKDPLEDHQAVDSTTKSRLLELLTSESSLDDNKADPLTQLKEVLSDPELVVPDPLLVPRARLSALIANPAKEIPRLLSQKSETYSYPRLLTDPDLLVVSLAHLQTLLQSTGKDEDLIRYQHAQYLQQHLKQEQSTLDTATANALNQMLWLPYLSQLETAAMACGNNQDFLAMLNLVFPPSGYGQNPYMPPTSPALNGYDYKNQLEFQQTLAMWQEAMLHAGQPNQTPGVNNNMSKLQQEVKYNPKLYNQQQHPVKHHDVVKHTSARTSPIAMNYQQQRHRSATNQQQYLGLESLVNRQAPQGSSYRPHAYQRSQSYNHDYTAYRPSSAQPHLPPPKTEPLRPPSIGTTLEHKSHKHNPNPTCKSMLSKQNQHYNVKSVNKNHQLPVDMYKFVNIPQLKHAETHHKDVSVHSAQKAPASVVDLSGKKEVEVPKLKVKQHLIDPNARPRLLKFEDPPEVGSTTGSLPTPGLDETHPHLWHPLFSSQQQKSYSSPWQWTTPVVVNGE